MRISRMFALPLIAGLLAFPARTQAQVRVQVNARLGPPVGVVAYSRDRWGDWRSNYRRWTPVTLYVVDGRYYQRNVRGARAVLVYRHGNEYFLPPQERAWVGVDRRYNYKRRPIDDDYVRLGVVIRP
jgi:hypothetical protein